MSECLHCKKTLTTDNPKAKFCSSKCKVYHSRGVKHKPNLMKEEVGKVEIPVTAEELTPAGPRVFPHDMTSGELKMRLQGGMGYMHIVSSGIRGYNKWCLENDMPWHCVTVGRLQEWLAKSGYDPKLARGVGWEPPHSEFFARHEARLAEELKPSTLPE